MPVVHVLVATLETKSEVRNTAKAANTNQLGVDWCQAHNTTVR
jgi:hypothetical protein